jgi:osmotically-inducible protein OsmY
MAQNSLAERIQQQLAEQARITHVVVAEDRSRLILSGRVESDEQRQRAGQIAARLAPGARIENDLEVEAVLPYGSAGNNALLAEDEDSDIPVSEAGFEKEGISLEPGLTSEPLETDAINVVDPDVVTDTEPVEPEPAYFPPTDPVLTVGEHGILEVAGGFEASSLDDTAVERSAEDNQPGDEALADAIRRELREDALTTDLQVDVAVERGVAVLRGIVSDVEDTENAEEVASRIPGVLEVIDEMRVAGF